MQVPLANKSQSIFGCLRISTLRTGDVALFLVWAIFAAFALSGAFDEIRDHQVLAAAYRTMVAAVFFLNATLFLSRGPAIKRSGGLASKFFAFAGTWSVVLLSLLPLKWRADWLLAVTTIGLICAYSFVFWALLTLRRNFSVFPEARNLVRHGPYALVRHPLYSAYILTYLLIALPRFGPAALVLAVIGITGEMLRARHEERLLSLAFPDYAAYTANTPRFVPRIP
ncbi:MAG: methyltransferase family protein [Thermomicrobiales bacterium]